MINSRSRPDFSEAWKTAFRHASSGYFFFLPGIAITWFLTETAAAFVKGPIGAVSPLLFFFGLIFYAAAAARAAGRLAGNVVMLGITRASTFLSTFYLLLLGLLSGLLIFGIVYLLGGKQNDMLLYCGGAAWCLLIFAIILRFWPILVLIFHYGGYIRWIPVSHGSSGSLWFGPGLGTAWKMTSLPGAFLGASLPLAGLFLFFGGGWLALRLLLQPAGLALFVINALFYVGVLPPLVCLTDALAAQLMVPTKWGRY